MTMAKPTISAAGILFNATRFLTTLSLPMNGMYVAVLLILTSEIKIRKIDNCLMQVEKRKMLHKKGGFWCPGCQNYKEKKTVAAVLQLPKMSQITAHYFTPCLTSYSFTAWMKSIPVISSNNNARLFLVQYRVENNWNAYNFIYLFIFLNLIECHHIRHMCTWKSIYLSAMWIPSTALDTN